VLGPCGTDCLNDLEREAGAVFEASSILVGALIGERGQELM